MAVKRSPTTGRFMTSRRDDLKAGSHVTVAFGRHDAEGVVLGKTITGRYSVKVVVDGADEPVTTSYSREELRVAKGH